MAMSRRAFPPGKSLPDNRRSTSFVMFLIALFSPIVSMSLLLSVQHFSLLIGWMLTKVASFLADRTNKRTDSFSHNRKQRAFCVRDKRSQSEADSSRINSIATRDFPNQKKNEATSRLRTNVLTRRTDQNATKLTYEADVFADDRSRERAETSVYLNRIEY